MTSEPGDFTLCMRDVVGDTLRVVPTDRRSSKQLAKDLGMTGARAWRLGGALRACSDYELRAGDGILGSLIFGETALARLACAEGVWSLQKRCRLGWELVITSASGENSGWYSGRHWLPGGTIVLATGSRVKLSRAPSLHWKLRAGGGEVIAAIRTHGGLRKGIDTSLTIRSIPDTLGELSLLVLTACAVLTLERAIPVVPVSG
jgi:hypothetical protein